MQVATRRDSGRYVNPFYVLLVVAGVVFLLTVFAYAVMTVNMLDAQRAAEIRRSDRGLLHFMDVHGVRMMVIELVVMAIMTVGAIGTDGWWKRWSQSRK